MSTFAVDFDGTFTTDPEAFRLIVDLLRLRGHTVIMVTQRCPQYEAELKAVIGPLELFNAVIYASGQTKRDAAAKAGYKVDVWMEDNPESILTAYRYKGCPD